MKIIMKLNLISVLVLSIAGISCTGVKVRGQSPNSAIVRINPIIYEHALRNPLMGLRPSLSIAAENEYATLAEWRVGWNQLEDKEADTIEKIRQVCDQDWNKFNIQKNNIKLIVRVMTYNPGFNKKEGKQSFWPSDLTENDWESETFRKRMVRLVDRLATVWDNDPRVAYVEMGILGNWGEQIGEKVGSTPENRQRLGAVFMKDFTHKRVLVRQPMDWGELTFGGYWDSFAHADQMNTYYPLYEQFIQSRAPWKTEVFGGECAYDWGNYQIQPGEDPNDTMSDPVHRNYLIDCIRSLHTNYLGWVSNYYPGNLEARKGADLVQQALGYRFILEQVTYPATILRDIPFEVAFTVKNEGSTPFYYPWPVEVSLLDPVSRKLVWKDTFSGIDIRSWLPGDKWNRGSQKYDDQPVTYQCNGGFTLPKNLPPGKYILALAILDPDGNSPTVRFSTTNYFNGGRHPIGYIGVEEPNSHPELDGVTFDDPQADRSLHYGS
jgi:hypothetical protein